MPSQQHCLCAVCTHTSLSMTIIWIEASLTANQPHFGIYVERSIGRSVTISMIVSVAWSTLVAKRSSLQQNPLHFRIYFFVIFRGYQRISRSVYKSALRIDVEFSFQMIHSACLISWFIFSVNYSWLQMCRRKKEWRWRTSMSLQIHNNKYIICILVNRTGDNAYCKK